ncbi:anti-sigma F factor [Qiania dongpingensis]
MDRKLEGNRNMESKKKDRAGETVHLEFESHSHNEQFARVVSAVFAARLDPTVEEIEDIKTAVSEAVTNAIIHGYEKEIGVVHLDLTIEDKSLTIVVRDEGAGIANVKQAMEPLYTSKPSKERSGMGFSFMEAFMDEVTVESELGKGTEVRMVKRIGSIFPL